MKAALAASMSRKALASRRIGSSKAISGRHQRRDKQRNGGSLAWRMAGSWRRLINGGAYRVK